MSAADATEGMINVPNTQGASVTVTGDGQYPVKVWFDSSWTHSIIVAGKTTILQEQHGTGQKIIMTGVPALYFNDNVGVTLPDLKPIGGAGMNGPGGAAAGGPAAASSGLSVGGAAAGGAGGFTGAAAGRLFNLNPSAPFFRGPTLPKPTHPGEIVAIQLINETEEEIPSRVVTFGHAFVKGDLPQGTSIVAKGQNDSLQTQTDVKTRYSDGSVKHAIISLQTPILPPGGGVTLMLTSAPGTGASPPISPSAILAKGYDLTLTREFPAADGLPPLVAQAATVLSLGAADRSIKTWLSGPLATEYRVSQKVLPNLLVTFDIRATADGVVTTDVIVANDYAYLLPQNSTYSSTIAQTGMQTWKSPFITHRKFQVWHKLVSNRERPLPAVLFDVDYLERTGALPNFDLSAGLARIPLENARAAFDKADTGPLGNALVMRDMGTTGGRGDIGPTTVWSANYLISQSPDARAIMLAEADAAGSIPWHLHEVDGRMVTAAGHPQLWLDSRCDKADCLPGNYSDAIKSTGWTLDSAHEPDLAFVPYLTTGSHFYLDQLQSEANWDILSQNADYRKNDKGLVYPSSQVRGTAWNLRDIANAVWISPDDDPLKPYFETVLKNNLDGLNELYLTGRAMRQTGSIEGFISDPYNKQTVGPWQQDFLAMTMAQEAHRGSEPAGKFAGWMQNFIAGRFIHGADGYDPLRGPAYYLTFADERGNITADSWASLYAHNFSGKPAPDHLDGTPDASDDYAAVARAATASLFSLTQDPRALRAFAFIVGNTQPMLNNFPNGSAFNINPRLSDDYVLRNDEIQYAPDTGGRVSAKHAHSLLVGSKGPTTLQGAQGISILVGGTGPIALIGASGVNYFFPGSGDTVVSGAAGRNYVGPASGKLQIDLGAQDVSVDQIDGFRPGKDHIHLIGLNTDLGRVLATATKTSDGSAVVTVGPNHTVTFTGLAPAEVTAAFFD